jgi:hypothetical protein
MEEWRTENGSEWWHGLRTSIDASAGAIFSSFIPPFSVLSCFQGFAVKEWSRDGQAGGAEPLDDSLTF